MADIVITAEDIAKAMTYIPLTAKEGFARNIAPFCLEPVDVNVGIDQSFPLPNRVRENRKLAQQYKMGFLAYYLRKDFKTQEAVIADGETIELTMCMDESEYDLWASSHVFNQLERLKKSKDSAETANRVFDLLYDYKMMENMLNLAIRDEVEARNDVFNRAAEFFVETMTEDAIKEMMAKQKQDMAAVAEDLEQYAEERKVLADG